MFDKLIISAKSGDKRAKEEIINRLQPLIISSIKRYYNYSYEYEDLVQDGNLMILQCIEDYDESKGAQFLGYVKLRLKYMYLLKHRTKRHLSLNEPAEDGEIEIIDILVSENKGVLDLVLEKEMSIRLRKAIEGLTSRQREIIICYYIGGRTLEEVSEMLGISYRTVVNTKARAMEKLKRAFVTHL